MITKRKVLKAFYSGRALGFEEWPPARPPPKRAYNALPVPIRDYWDFRPKFR